MLEHQLVRWVKASINTHFYNLRQGVHLHLEGRKRQTEGLSEWYELRVDGPIVICTTKKKFKLECIINILINVALQNNIHRIDELTGRVENMFTRCIPVYRYGPSTDPENDNSFISHLVQRSELDIVNFGELKNQVELTQMTLEQEYDMRYFNA